MENKDIKVALLEDLQNEFFEEFKTSGLKIGLVKLSLLDNRTKIINKICKTTEERHIVNSNYDKVLKQVAKIVQSDELAKNAIDTINKELTEKEQKEQEKQERIKKYNKQLKKQKRKEKKKRIDRIITIILLLPLIIFYIAFKMCLGLAEGQKNGKRKRF